MCCPNVASKEGCDFARLIGIRTKFCHTMGTFVIAGESAIAVFGCDEVRDCSHGQVYALTNFLDGRRTLSSCLIHVVSRLPCPAKLPARPALLQPAPTDVVGPHRLVVTTPHFFCCIPYVTEECYDFAIPRRGARIWSAKNSVREPLPIRVMLAEDFKPFRRFVCSRLQRNSELRDET